MAAKVPRWVWQTAVVVIVVELFLLGYGRAQAAASHLRLAQEQVRPDLRRLQAACDQVESALSEAAPFMPLVQVAGALPLARAKAWGELPHLAEAAEHGCRALRTAAPLVPANESGPPPGMALLAALRLESQPARAASEQLAAALAALARVDRAVLGAEPLLAPSVRVLQAVAAREDDLRTAAQLGPQLPDLADRLLGGDRPRVYLLVGQNNDEARATGGFIGTLGLLRVAQGQIVGGEVRSSYLWDNPAAPKLVPPLPLQRYMNVGAWYLRDANWWLDFRRSAQQLLLMWEREQGGAESIDGVIAVDRFALDRLLEAVDGVSVPELGGRVDASNVGDLLDQRRRSPEALQSQADYHRLKSQVLGAVYQALLQAVVDARGPKLLRVLDAFGRSADERHLLVWLRDPELQGLVAARGWDGRVEAGPDDFLGVVDTSVSYGKLAPYLQKSVSYARGPDGTAQVIITYRNHYRPTLGAPWDPIVDGTWWDWRASAFRRQQGAWLGYVRVLTPAGSRLVSSDGWEDAPTVSEEGGVAILAGPVLVAPGESRTVALRYVNPTPPDAPLHLYRQPGDPTS